MGNVKERVKKLNQEINKRKTKLILEEAVRECDHRSTCDDPSNPCPYYDGGCILKKITDTYPYEWNI